MKLPAPTSGKPSFKHIKINDINRASGHSRKARPISVPNKSMIRLQQAFVSSLRALCIKMPSAKGCLPGCSPAKNIRFHQDLRRKRGFRFNRYFVLYDLKGAYQNVQLSKLVEMGLIIDLETDEDEFRRFLESYCFDSNSEHGGGIYTGSPSSPDLFNLYAECFLDRFLRDISKEHGLTYTRYLDDLVFSSSWPMGQMTRKKICKVIREAGFEISSKKAQVLDLKKGPIVINGIGLRDDGTTFLPRHMLRHIDRLLHATLEGKPKEPVKDLVSRIHGLMGMFHEATKNSAPGRSELQVLQRYETLKQRFGPPPKQKKKRRR